MKILINACIIGDIPNGFTIYAVNILNLLIDDLKAAEHEVTLLSSHSKFLDKLNVEKRYSPAFLKSSRKHNSLNAILRLGFNTFVLPFYSLKYDVIYSPTPHGMVLPVKKQVVTVHDFISLEFPMQHRFQYYYTKYCLHLVLKASKRIIVISDATNRILKENFPTCADKTLKIYNGCEKIFYPRPDSTEKIKKKYGFTNYILACGLAYPHKNIKLLIEAFCMLPEEVRNSHPLVIVGNCNNSYAQELQGLAQASITKNSIYFTGNIEQDDLPLLYSAAKVFVYPSLCEGFGLPPVEALQCGTSCIVSDIPIMHEILGTTVEYFNPISSMQLCDKISSIISKPKKTPESIPSYCWENSAKKIFDALIS